MGYKGIGALLIIGGCGGYGFLLCMKDNMGISTLRDLTRILEFMAWELQFQMTPLPEICEKASHTVKGSLSSVFSSLADALQSRIQPNVSICMDQVLLAHPHIPQHAGKILADLGSNLGRFDLEGQLQALESARSACMNELHHREQDRLNRLRTYQTLGLCTGAALAILLL